jgi:hypothetical protein
MSGPSGVSISCIVPTADRPAAIPLLLAGVESQTCQDVELVIVDGGMDSVEDLVRGHTRVRYVRVPPDTTLGARRNLGCELARGEIVVHWDDDDWYAPERLARQVDPIVRGEADVTGLVCRHVLALAERRWWGMTDWLHRRLFVGDVHGGTLAYRRSLFDARVRYPDINLAEDAQFLGRALQQGARLARVDGLDLFAYVRHGRNAWNCVPGELVRPDGWIAGEAPRGMDLDTITRYAEALPGAPERRPFGRGPGPAPMRHASRGSTLVDCLESTEILLTTVPAARDLCIAVVASESMAPLLDGLLTTLKRRGGCGDIPITVLAAGRNEYVEAVRRSHGVEVVPCRALRGTGPNLKGALYSLATVVKARQYLCLDADLLVLGELRSLFSRLDTSPPGSMLVAAEGPPGRTLRLAEGLEVVHRASREEIDKLCGDPSLKDRVLCVNDGVMLADRTAFEAVDRAVRDNPEWLGWCFARQDVRWRQKGVLTLALASGGRPLDLDPLDNLQLHATSVQEDVVEGEVRALWDGKAVRVLHFNGVGRRYWDQWRRVLL